MAREKQRVFKESLAPKKLVKESKLEEGKKIKFLVLNVGRDAYGPTDVGGTMTVEELIEALQQWDMSLPVVFGNDYQGRYGWYTYGAVTEDCLMEENYQEDDEDEDIDESKEKGHAKFKQGKNPLAK